MPRSTFRFNNLYNSPCLLFKTIVRICFYPPKINFIYTSTLNCEKNRFFKFTEDTRGLWLYFTKCYNSSKCQYYHGDLYCDITLCLAIKIDTHLKINLSCCWRRCWWRWNCHQNQLLSYFPLFVFLFSWNNFAGLSINLWKQFKQFKGSQSQSVWCPVSTSQPIGIVTSYPARTGKNQTEPA